MIRSFPDVKFKRRAREAHQSLIVYGKSVNHCMQQSAPPQRLRRRLLEEERSGSCAEDFLLRFIEPDNEDPEKDPKDPEDDVELLGAQSFFLKYLGNFFNF